jgi:enoyl-CoA hydratase/carnithine racemase
LLTAERVPATQALTLGLVDELAPSPDLVEAAARRALSAARKPARLIRNWKMEIGNWYKAPHLRRSM